MEVEDKSKAAPDVGQSIFIKYDNPSVWYHAVVVSSTALQLEVRYDDGSKESIGWPDDDVLICPKTNKQRIPSYNLRVGHTVSLKTDLSKRLGVIIGFKKVSSTRQPMAIVHFPSLGSEKDKSIKLSELEYNPYAAPPVSGTSAAEMPASQDKQGKQDSKDPDTKTKSKGHDSKNNEAAAMDEDDDDGDETEESEGVGEYEDRDEDGDEDDEEDDDETSEDEIVAMKRKRKQSQQGRKRKKLQKHKRPSKKMRKDYRCVAYQLVHMEELGHDSAFPWIDKILDFRTRSENEAPGEANGVVPGSEKTEGKSSDQTSDLSKIDIFVKFYGKSHFHNKWIRLQDAQNPEMYLGANRVETFLKDLKALRKWKRNCGPDAIESYNIQREMNREDFKKWARVERIIGSALKNHDHEMKKDDSTDVSIPDFGNKEEIEFFVKWEGLPYGECTWESWNVLKTFSEKVDQYLDRLKFQRKTKKAPNLLKFQELKKNPQFVLQAGNKLRDYQVHGVNWMTHNFCAGTNCILADEMGLGKTIQIICLLGVLFKKHNVQGPFLVISPLSALPNWRREFKKWAPFLNTVVYTGNVYSRQVIRDYEFYEGPKTNKKPKFHALLTTYEFVQRDKGPLSKIPWQHLLIDEAHRLKNPNSRLYIAMNSFQIQHRVLITGTPLQNSMKELWALLNFLHPKDFGKMEDFEEKYKGMDDDKDGKIIQMLHKTLEPYLLRRTKKEVLKSLPKKVERILHVEMTGLQKKFYQWILAKNFRALNDSTKLLKGGAAKANRTSLMSTLTELKKCCNHCFLFPSGPVEAEKMIMQEDSAKKDEKSSSSDIRLRAVLLGSGKLALLDRLLTRLKETGHRVLIFSQMVRMLDVLSEYMLLRKHAFQRLDGTMASTLRQRALERFNAKGSKDFCFLLSTRAGGLGINLATADTVIIFDSDWNPQNDLQAFARCHRIGQEKTVNTYRLVTKDSVEEEIVERAKKKMILDHLVIQRMDTSGQSAFQQQELLKKAKKKKKSISNQDLTRILKFGAKRLFGRTKRANKSKSEPESKDTQNKDTSKAVQSKNSKEPGKLESGPPISATATAEETTENKSKESIEGEKVKSEKKNSESRSEDAEQKVEESSSSKENSEDKKEKNSFMEKIDSILKRDNGEETAKGADTDRFLNNFVVASFENLENSELDAGPERDDNDMDEEVDDEKFWEAIMPKHLIPQNQLDTDHSKPLLRSDRRRKLREKQILQQQIQDDMENAESADDWEDVPEGLLNDGSGKDSKKRKKSRLAIVDPGATEAKQIYRYLMFHGDISRALEHIYRTLWRVRRIEVEKAQQLAEMIISKCKEAAKTQAKERGASGRIKKKAITATVLEAPLNALSLLKRITQMETLRKQINEAETVYDYRIPEFKPYPPPPRWPPPRNLEWTNVQDSMLLLGVYLYGVGSWDEIVAEEKLGLIPHFCSPLDDEKQDIEPPVDDKSTEERKVKAESRTEVDESSKGEEEVDGKNPEPTKVQEQNSESISEPETKTNPKSSNKPEVESVVEPKTETNLKSSDKPEVKSSGDPAIQSSPSEGDEKKPETKTEMNVEAEKENSAMDIEGEENPPVTSSSPDPGVTETAETKSTEKEDDDETVEGPTDKNEKATEGEDKVVKGKGNNKEDAPPDASSVDASKNEVISPKSKAEINKKRMEQIIKKRVVSSSHIRARVLMLLKRIVVHERNRKQREMFIARQKALKEHMEREKAKKDSNEKKIDPATAAFRQGNYRLAIALWTGVLATDPNQPIILFNRGVSFIYIREFARAVEDLEKAAAAFPSNATVMGALKRAVESLEEEKSLSPNFNKSAEEGGSERVWWRVVRHGGLFIQPKMSLKSTSVGVLKEGEFLEGIRIGAWLKHSRGFSVLEQGDSVYIEKCDPIVSRRLSERNPVPEAQPFKRLKRCGKCEACLRPSCGTCRYCIDRKGPRILKQACAQRRCLAPEKPSRSSSERRRVSVPIDLTADDSHKKGKKKNEGTGAVNLQAGIFNLQQIAQAKQLGIKVEKEGRKPSVEMLRQMCLRYLEASHKMLVNNRQDDKIERQNLFRAFPHFQKAFAVLQNRGTDKITFLPSLTSKLHKEVN
mmetsp:Transcript_11498/g.28317  ORF Transcript_11498/g.28317 Transcript_11498/m.28317 type:complete len:2097 (+) Transcript_11498:249-6539(+)|eukprot:CAMPEP_0114505516 /NCGR_PEP_ID=MMETSP0109-20121206/10897_1 /TAXON_ID=29199 /ORGANISM="Chlorarachnion reptans, Strain CCCM449" /LENGTH=2096 /DNA_ID=CAMNT_0001683965 /DNA_START=234 /DNA_END=6524 /DNA_ORIENTATION=+